LIGMDFLYEEADFGPSLSSLNADVVLAGGDNMGCSSVSAAAEGKIVLIKRGDCAFADKAQSAQNAGAIAVMMILLPWSQSLCMMIAC
jgi:extracellular elastinolytic metalloproteinase